MKNSTHIVVLVLRRWALRQLFHGLIAVILLSAGSVCAQEKTAEPAHVAGWVVIPVAEYRELRAKVYPVEHEPEPPPADATLTRVDYELQVAGEVAAGRATLTVDVLKDGWVRVPVPAGLLVREARLEGKPLSLTPHTGKDARHVSALLSHSGRSVLVLMVDVPVTVAAGEETISLPSTESGVTRAAVELPRQGVDLRIGGGLLSQKSETADKTRLLAFGQGNEPLTFTWHKKIEERHVDLPLRMRGTLTQLVSLAEDSTSIYAEVNLDVVQGVAHEARVRLPENVIVNQVSGAMIADWEISSGELAVTFLGPVEQGVRFVITGETRLARDGILDIPLLRLLNTEREEGGVAVEVLGAGEIKGQKLVGLEEADATDLGETVASRQSPALIAFRVRSGAAGASRSLNVSVARYDQQAVLMANIEEARYEILMSADGKQLVRARYAVRNNQRNFVKITLPAGATVWSAALAGKPIRPGQSPDGSLLLGLQKSRGGEDAPAFTVEILYLTKAPAVADKSRTKLTLPELDLPISRSGLLLYYPPQFRITPEPGVFRMQDYQNPVSAALMVSSGDTTRAAAGDGAGPVTSRSSEEKKDSTQALLDRFRAKSTGGKIQGILPVNVSFPVFGPSLFLVSELTSENQTPAVEFSFQREKKGGAR